jgi:hypothetical protein
MKKLPLLMLALVLALTLAACGGGNTTSTTPPANNNPTNTPAVNTPSGNDNANTPADSTPSVNDNTLQVHNPAPTDTSLPDGGTFEGDANGYGVWIYHNNRYEGYFVDGVPNGEGVLYAAYECTGSHDGNTFHATLVVTRGTFVNGYAHGMITYSLYHCNGMITTWNLEMDMGYSVKPNEPMTAIDGESTIILGADDLMAVPPFVENVYTDPNIAPPDASSLPSTPDTTTPGTSTPDPTPSQSGPFILTFDANGGTVMGGATYSVTVVIAKPGEPEISIVYPEAGDKRLPDGSGDYSFGGWYYEDGTAWSSFDTLTSDITVYAKWIDGR